jgi:hypothetical protein
MVTLSVFLGLYSTTMTTLFVFPGLCMAIYQENKLSDIVTYATLSITVMGFYSYEPRERSSDYCETVLYW